MSKKERILIILAAVMVAILIFGFIYDRNSAVLKRTLPYDYSEELELVDMEKYGTMFYRVAYGAKFAIDHDNADFYVERICDIYGFAGEFLTYEEYKEFEASSIITNFSLKPVVEEGTVVWILYGQDENDNEILYIIESQSSSEAYMFVYYKR